MQSEGGGGRGSGAIDAWGGGGGVMHNASQPHADADAHAHTFGRAFPRSRFAKGMANVMANSEGKCSVTLAITTI